jgi:pimeloyl-ACP methyl ester carboxylesterase
MLRRIGDLTVNYEVAGSGAPLILIHGAGADLLTWDQVVPLLSPHATVWRMDQRGFGKTLRTAEPKLSLAVWTADLLAFMDAMQIEKAALVGWSMGAAVSINLAALNPERVTHLIPIGSPGAKQVVMDTSGFEARQRMADSGATVEEIVNETFQFTEAAFSRWSREHNRAAVEKMRQTLLRNDAQNYSETVTALGGLSDFGQLLGSVTAPTLIICGAEDGRTPPSLSESLQRAIRSSRIEVLPDCGHYYPFEKPVEIAHLISEFLDLGS